MSDLPEMDAHFWIKFGFNEIRDHRTTKVLNQFYFIVAWICSCNMSVSDLPEMDAQSQRAQLEDCGHMFHECPCYSHYVTLPRLIALVPIQIRPLGSLYMHAWKVQLWWAASNIVATIAIINGPVIQISQNIQLTNSANFAENISFSIVWRLITVSTKGLTCVACNVGVSAFKNMLQCLWMSCKTSSHLSVTFSNF